MSRGKDKKEKQRRRIAAAARAAAQNRRLDSFEPNMLVPQIRMHAAEDNTVCCEKPMTEEERLQDLQDVEQRQQNLTMAFDKETQERQKRAFVGSVVDYFFLVAKDAEAERAHEMDELHWKLFHERMYAKYIEYAQTCYKLFRRACEGNALQDPEMLRLLVIGRLRERSNKDMQDIIDEMSSKMITKRQMYPHMRADVERKRQERGMANKESLFEG